MKMKDAILEQVVVSALLAIAAALCLLSLPASAQSYTVLHAFEVAQDEPAGLIQASDGNFYGTTSEGGANSLGSVFVVTPAGTLTTIYSFSGCDGGIPYAGLVQGTDGNFFGTTLQGGASGSGTVFRITPAGALTTLYSFVTPAASSGPDGAFPAAALVQGADGNFYGTTYLGGWGGYGTVFELTPAGALTTLHSFGSALDDGRSPQTPLVQGADGNFYGTTSDDSAFATVFKITPTGTLTTLHTLAGSEWGDPSGLVQGTDGNFYGTKSDNFFSNGTVFKMTPTGTLTTLYSFSGSNGTFPDGASPRAGLMRGSDGNFYGTAFRGGASADGTLFRITPAGVLTTLYSFSGSDGASPSAGLVQGSDGNFYGKTSLGGANGKGTIFKIAPAGVLTTLCSFSNNSDGAGSYATLVRGTDGSFYGTTNAGGTNNLGTVFKISPAGALSTLYSFTGSDGASPTAGVVVGIDGNYYGTTVAGGANSSGTVFKITPTGTLTTLSSFAPGNKGFSTAALVQGTDENLYGTTPLGGASNLGTVFKVTPAGVLATLYSFAGSDGANPTAGLVLGTDGNFYGTTSGGTSGNGTVFKITPAGTLTTLHSFSLGDAGVKPNAGLVLGKDGNFYGTTAGKVFGRSVGPTVFKITSAGELTTIHVFTLSEGDSPFAALVQGIDGNFYGTTRGMGLFVPFGGVFKITPAGELTTLHLFSYDGDGAFPSAGLVQGTDGNFYGTTPVGGPLGGGVVFRLTPGPGPAPTVTSASPASGPVSGGTVVTVSGTDFQPFGTVDFGGTAAAAITYGSATTVYAVVPPHVVGAVNVTVTNPDLQAGSLASGYTYTCPWTATAFNGGPYCAGATIALSTPTVPGATYAWTGPNGFASALQNPTVPAATTVATGAYSVTATVAGCTSSPGSTNVMVNQVPAVPAVTAPSTVGAGSQAWTASVPLHAASTYSWTIGNGTITSVQGTSQITFTAGMAGTPLTLSVTETNASGCVSVPGNATVTVAPAAASYHTMTPCRIVDTRNPDSPLGGPPIAAQSIWSFTLTETTCSLPQGVQGVSMNVTVADATSTGSLTIYPGTGAAPGTNTLNFTGGFNRANNVILGLTGGVLSVQNNQPFGTVNLIIDVNGYFQ